MAIVEGPATRLDAERILAEGSEDAGAVGRADGRSFIAGKDAILAAPVCPARHPRPASVTGAV